MSKPGEQTSLRGRVARITYHNPDNGYTVARVEAGGGAEVVTVVGAMPGVAEGQQVEVRGRAVLHPKFGPQIEAEAVELVAPSDEEGVRRYLASGLVKGVGPVLAGRIVDALGSKAVELILEDPQKLGKVPGIGNKKRKTILDALRSQAELREVMVFLQGHGVPAGTAMRIWRRYGAGALGVLQSEPHRLASDVRGIGFATADDIAARLGLEPDHPSRLRAGLTYALSRAVEEGHVYLPRGALLERATAILDVPGELLPPQLEQLHLEGVVAVEGRGDDPAVYLAGLRAAEDSAARHLARLGRAEGLLPPQRAAAAVQWVTDQLAVTPSPGQAAALETLLGAGLAVLTGGPGTGKTTLVRALLTVAQRMNASVALAAPTGRAAKRLAEAAGREAMTLHRLLEYSPKDNKFLRGVSRPLEVELVVVDESSMIDLWLGAALTQAVGPGTRLVLVGDADQLPPVGPGLLFRQLIDSQQVPVARLTEIHRQDEAGLIVRNAHCILHGQMPELPARGQERADFFFINEPDPAQAAALVADLASRRLPAHYGLDPMTDVQVLAPMHKGLMGCQNLNRLLRQRLNPGAGEGGALASGDKVLQARNNYDLEVFNGDVGLVEAMDDDGAWVRMDERRVLYPPNEQDNLGLAFAMTVHKSQGSEYPAVVLALGREHFIMLNRPLLYTAVTRGKRLVVIVGSQRALARAVHWAEPAWRHSLLDQRLRALLSNNQPMK